MLAHEQSFGYFCIIKCYLTATDLSHGTNRNPALRVKSTCPLLRTVHCSETNRRLRPSRQDLRGHGRAAQRLQGRSTAFPAGGDLGRGPDELPLLPVHHPLLRRPALRGRRHHQAQWRRQRGVGLGPQLVLSRPHSAGSTVGRSPRTRRM